MMPCSATAALQDKIMADRDETPQEREELRARVLERANAIQRADGFVSDVIGEIPETYFQAVILLDVSNLDDTALEMRASVGKKILRAIRDAAIKQAEQELGW